LLFKLVCFGDTPVRLVLAPGETSCFPSSILNQSYARLKKKRTSYQEKKTLEDFPANLYSEPTKIILWKLNHNARRSHSANIAKNRVTQQTIKKPHSHTFEIPISRIICTKYTHDVFKCYYYSFASHILYFKRRVFHAEVYVYT